MCDMSPVLTVVPSGRAITLRQESPSSLDISYHHPRAPYRGCTASCQTEPYSERQERGAHLTPARPNEVYDLSTVFRVPRPPQPLSKYISGTEVCLIAALPRVVLASKNLERRHTNDRATVTGTPLYHRLFRGPDNFYADKHRSKHKESLSLPFWEAFKSKTAHAARKCVHKTGRGPATQSPRRHSINCNIFNTNKSRSNTQLLHALDGTSLQHYMSRSLHQL